MRRCVSKHMQQLGHNLSKTLSSDCKTKTSNRSPGKR
uniref:Uncharacterized protein n=1 Tax=Arundo donax TaxID=35708 RepID=A0A0A9HAG5_ARUDO